MSTNQYISKTLDEQISEHIRRKPKSFGFDMQNWQDKHRELRAQRREEKKRQRSLKLKEQREQKRVAEERLIQGDYWKR